MHHRRSITTALLAMAMLAVTSCSGSSGSSGSASSSSSSSSTSAASGGAIVNVWVGPPADTTKLPIGTSKVSLTEPSVGGLHACDAGNARGGGAFAAGPWLDEAADTWDLSKKISVQGQVSWPMASYSEVVEGSVRRISSNSLPVGQVTGTFPIAASDPASSYDRNPNRIAANDVTLSLPASPGVAASPTCLGKGRIGILKNGVSLFAPLDERNRDAVAYETQDSCDGHPQQTSVYHYHDIPSCIRDAATGPSTVVGFANDGFPIVVERDAAGNLPTDADLDACHGHTSSIELDGEIVEMYHYSATYEFPYFIGCFAGTPVS
ncbi:MAG: YHYH protein [Acidobacteria bacterium]|nr:YHYH protein [Acidobacteriota bacterium]